VDTYDDPAPGAGQFVLLDSGTCSSLTAALDIANPGGVGVTDLSFDPGLGIPAGSALSIVSGGSVEADVSAFGYSTSASNVPAVTESTAGVPPQR
jgi:hypothetical protein